MDSSSAIDELAQILTFVYFIDHIWEILIAFFLLLLLIVAIVCAVRLRKLRDDVYAVDERIYQVGHLLETRLSRRWYGTDPEDDDPDAR